jgi:hypothetical protein
MARRKQAPKDLTGIRQLGSTYQVRISGGIDPVTGRQLFLSSSADTQDAAIVLRDRGAGYTSGAPCVRGASGASLSWDGGAVIAVDQVPLPAVYRILLLTTVDG